MIIPPSYLHLIQKQKERELLAEIQLNRLSDAFAPCPEPIAERIRRLFGRLSKTDPELYSCEGCPEYARCTC